MNAVVISGGRSDWGILKPLAERLDAYVIHCDAYLRADTTLGIARCAGLTAVTVADELALADPDLVVVLGDRYEILAAVQSAYHMNIPIVHLHGGETTLGSRDDSMRHAITQLADVHLVSTDKAAAKVHELGKHSVHVIGAIGAYNAYKAKPEHRADVIVSVPADPVVYAVAMEACEGLDALVLGPNDDLGRSKIRGIPGLAPDEFLSVLKGAKVIVGNSSCGLIEAPSAGTWSVNIGDRQEGRERAASVIDVAADIDRVSDAVRYCLTYDFPQASNPYFHGNSIEKAAMIIESMS